MNNLWDRIDLDRHGVIEAHAGTGKTYTIVKLVLRILETEISDADGRNRLIHLREIMVVTFSEKAAGELKKRIREGIEERINHRRKTHPSDGAIEAHLENCLATIHESLIGTIHAVCLRLLRSWPFESGIPFITEIIDDAEGLASTLRESMRRDWQDPATGIPWVLQKMADAGTLLEEGHYELLRRTAKELLDDNHVMLDRTASHNRDLSVLRREYEALLRQMREHEHGFSELTGDLIDALEQAKGSGRMEADRIALLDKRLIDLRKMKNGIFNESVLKKPCKVGNSGIYTKPDIKKIPGIARADQCCCRMLEHPFYKVLQQKFILDRQFLITLIGDAAEILARRWGTVKRENGYISYQDMLRLTHTAVTQRPAFAAALRNKLRYAIIDEFQDTSRLQWEIFSNLFLKDCGPRSPRLYIVGDPKQSIYAFQGADVGSYLDARATICSIGGSSYRLVSNFRSLEKVIDGYNAIFTSREMDDDWFLFAGTRDGISYRIENLVKPSDRSIPAAYPLPFPPVQVMPLGGTAPERIRMMAEHTCNVIRHLIGTMISLPSGTTWKNITLGYEHFAVIVETHKLADPFLAAFRDRRIPAVKYKMEGVFQSPVARAIHTLLQAILSPSGDPASRRAALLTLFFNRKPASVDPDRDLEPCPDAQCHGDALCITHALQEWTGLADNAYWSQLFDSICRRTGILERLIRLNDGERHIADFRQIVDYCIELLYCRTYTLTHLAEHLDKLLTNETGVGLDRNLHVLETQQSSVKILTMHASKGLEFPVVFAVTGRSPVTRRGPNMLRYTDAGSSSDCTGGSGDDRPIKIAAYLSIDDINDTMGRPSPEDFFLKQANQERRRLLYVALTRVQAILFVPVHLEQLPEKPYEKGDWLQKHAPTDFDEDLTPKLLQLLDNNNNRPSIALFDPSKFFVRAENDTMQVSGSLPNHPPDGYPDIGSLALVSRICRQTSYSQLSREMPAVREIDRSEEVDDTIETALTVVPSPLQGGKHTGDALHCALEEILGSDDIPRLIAEEAELKKITEKYLRRNGIFIRSNQMNNGPETRADDAIAAACRCIRGALTTAFILPDNSLLGGIATIGSTNRRAEMEFQLQVGRHWVHGYMDLVFRINAPGCPDHPWRYFVLDWKSDTLDAYDDVSIYQCIRERHYDLQAKLYSNALDEFLRGVLGGTYDPACHLGGAIYLFLREHERQPVERASVWTYAASPEHDREFVIGKVMPERI